MLLMDRQINRAIGEGGLNRLPGMQVSRPRDGLALPVAQPGVATLQHGVWIERLQPQAGAIQPLPFALQAALHFLRILGRHPAPAGLGQFQPGEHPVTQLLGVAAQVEPLPGHERGRPPDAAGSKIQPLAVRIEHPLHFTGPKAPTV